MAEANVVSFEEVAQALGEQRLAKMRTYFNTHAKMGISVFLVVPAINAPPTLRARFVDELRAAGWEVVAPAALTEDEWGVVQRLHFTSKRADKRTADQQKILADQRGRYVFVRNKWRAT